MPELPQGRLFQHFSFLDTNQVIVGHLDLDFDFGLYLSRVFLTVMIIPLRVKLPNPLASLGIQLQPSQRREEISRSRNYKSVKSMLSMYGD
jgi:hypothetical protein